MGSARVPRAADGVPPVVSSSHSSLTVWWFSQAEKSFRRDAANHTPEACAPHFQLHGYGEAGNGSRVCLPGGRPPSPWPTTGYRLPNPAGLVSENEIGTYPDRMDLKQVSSRLALPARAGMGSPCRASGAPSVLGQCITSWSSNLQPPTFKPEHRGTAAKPQESDLDKLA